MGTTDSSGVLRLALPPGQHSITCPCQVNSKAVVVEFSRGFCEPQDVVLHVGGELSFCLVPMDETKDGVQVTTNQHQISTEANAFAGTVLVGGKSIRATASSSRSRPLKPTFTLGWQHEGKCGSVIQKLQIQPSGGHFERKEEIDDWVGQFEGACVAKVLFEGTPLTLGMSKSGLELAIPMTPQLSLVERHSPSRSSVGSMMCEAPLALRNAPDPCQRSRSASCLMSRADAGPRRRRVHTPFKSRLGFANR